jgi:hypothetical protein
MSDNSIVLATDLGEWGVFIGEPPSPADPQPIAGLPDNVRQDLKIVYVEGLAAPLQFSRVTLASLSGSQTNHVVVSAYPPFPREAIADTGARLSAACSPAAVSLVVQDQVGRAKASCLADASTYEVAAAVAHAKIVGGWDETDPIVVTVNDDAFQVSGRFGNNAWWLTVDRAR